MKFKIQILTIVMFTIVSKAIYGQEVEVFIQNMSYINGGAISDCSTIDFEDNSTVTVQFGVELKKPSAMVVGNSNLRIYTKKSSTINEVERYSQDVQESFWTTGDPQFFNVSLSITLDADEFNVSGGIFYAEFESSSGNKYSGCNYSIVKDEVPTFEISPSSTTVSCGSSSPKTFTVDNVYNSPGTLVYQWQVGNGWQDANGNIVSNFTTSTNTIELTPYLYPPSNVTVTPILDGVSYPPLTANVGLGGFNPVYQITGASSLCSTATYSVNNLPAGITVTSWSVSNNNIATISGNGNQATLTATGNGEVTVTAILTNSCNQTATIFKENIDVGNPSFPNTAMSGESTPVVGESKYYSVPEASGATNYYWYFDVGNSQTGTNIDGWEIEQGQGTTGVFVKVGNPGSTVIVCRATNNCGNRIKYKYVSPRTQSDPCDEELRIVSNPIKSDKLAGRPIFIEDPCDDPWNGQNRQSSVIDKYTIDIFNNFGRLVYSKSQTDKQFDVSELKKGFYFVKYQTKKGKVITKKLIVK